MARQCSTHSPLSSSSFIYPIIESVTRCLQLDRVQWFIPTGHILSSRMANKLSAAHYIAEGGVCFGAIDIDGSPNHSSLPIPQRSIILLSLSAVVSSLDHHKGKLSGQHSAVAEDASLHLGSNPSIRLSGHLSVAIYIQTQCIHITVQAVFGMVNLDATTDVTPLQWKHDARGSLMTSRRVKAMRDKMTGIILHSKYYHR